MSFIERMRSIFKDTKSPPETAETNRSPEKAAEPGADFHRLSCKDGAYYITSRAAYRTDGTLKPQTIAQVFNFAYSMTFTSEGEHRSTRSGGNHSRKNGEIFANTFQGKLAECAACNFFYQYDKNVQPDFSISKLGKWDTSDLTVCGREIAVKSTKDFGQLLLLETKDWDDAGNYIPNLDKTVSSYDCILLIRMKPSCEDILKQNRILYTNTAEREKLYSLLMGQSWSYNFAGFITKTDLINIIRSRQIIKKGALLNGKTKMDADNYYVQAGDLRDISQYGELFR